MDISKHRGMIVLPSRAVSFALDGESREREEYRRFVLELVITRVEYLYHSDCFEIYAMSEKFRELRSGEQIPVYKAIIKTESDGCMYVLFEEEN